MAEIRQKLQSTVPCYLGTMNVGMAYFNSLLTEYSNLTHTVALFFNYCLLWLRNWIRMTVFQYYIESGLQLHVLKIPS